MDRDFWLTQWETGSIGFHQSDINPHLAAHWPSLGVPADATVFVPLCGKSLDMRYLRGRGHHVIGVELAESAVVAFFEEAKLPAQRSKRGPFELFAGDGFELLVGDVFAVTAVDLQSVAGVYDRAALVALPPELRRKYANVLIDNLPDAARVLLIAFEYDQRRVSGPPFSVPEDEVRALYEPAFEVTPLERHAASTLPHRLEEAGVSDATGAVYALRRRSRTR